MHGRLARSGWGGLGGDEGWSGEVKWEIERRKGYRGSGSNFLVGLKRARALTSVVGLKFEMTFKVGRIDGPLTGTNLPTWGTISK